MKAKVILTRKYASQAIGRLSSQFDLVIAEKTGCTLAELLLENADAQALISFLSDPVMRETIDSMPQLKIIANFAVGYNNIDFHHAIEKKIWVCHTPDVLTNATADLTLALILAVSRRIVEADTYLRNGHFTGWRANLMLGKELSGATLGIIGMGRIGLATAMRAKGFGMSVVYYSRHRKPDLEKKPGFRYMPFQQLIQAADIISLHLPYTADVHHLFNRDAFDLMKKDAIFINVSRGGLMDETCLAEKLERGELFGAGLDVYEFEPKVTEKLKSLKNTVILPHIGSATEKTRLTMAMMTVESVFQALSGAIPANLIPEWKKKLSENQ